MSVKDKLKSNVPQIQNICDYLIKECKKDEHLTTRVMIEAKTVENMYEYILKAVKNRYAKQIVNQSVMVNSDDVYNMAVHYFIEDDETLNKEFPNNVSKDEVKRNTVPVEVKAQVKPKEEKPNKVSKVEQQLSLFDLGDEENGMV